jgi:hypothetical protein
MTRGRPDLVLRTIELGNVNKGSNGFFGGRRDTDSVNHTEETALDLHDLRVNLPTIESRPSGVIGGTVSLHAGKINILIEVDSVGGRDNRVNRRSTCFVVSQALEGRDEFLELLQPCRDQRSQQEESSKTRLRRSERLAMVASEGLLAA